MTDDALSCGDSPSGFAPSGAATPVEVVPRADKELSYAYEPPRSDLERTLTTLWSERLGVWPVGVNDDFFELGGHSLAAAELLVDIETFTGVEVTARTLFLQPTVAELAAAIEAADPVVGADR